MKTEWKEHFGEDSHPGEQPYYVVDLGEGWWGEVDKQDDGTYMVWFGDDKADQPVFLGKIGDGFGLQDTIHLATVMLSCYLGKIGARYADAAEEILEAQHDLPAPAEVREPPGPLEF